MAMSEVQICNLGLVRIGSDPNIVASLNEDSAEARACNAVYSIRRDALLAMAPWGFASSFVTLAATNQTAPTDWAYEYQYPNDCLSLIKIVNPAGRTAPPIPHKRGRNAEGKNVIWTNQANAVALIVQQVTDPTRFSPDFADTLAWAVGMDACVPLTHSEKILSFCTKGYQLSLQNALRNNAGEEEIGTEGAPVDWLEVRG